MGHLEIQSRERRSGVEFVINAAELTPAEQLCQGIKQVEKARNEEL
jgi:hypothetical protein